MKTLSFQWLTHVIDPASESRDSSEGRPGAAQRRAASRRLERGEQTVMASYRLYFMDPRSGHIERVEPFEANGDEDAIARAESHRSAAPLELWSEDRKVHRLERSPQLAPGPDRAVSVGDRR